VRGQETHFDGKTRVKTIVYYPPVAFFAPIALGGVGCCLRDIVGGANDFHCAFEIHSDPFLLRHCNAFGYVIENLNAGRYQKILARSAIRKGVKIDGEMEEIRGIKFINDVQQTYDSQRYHESRIAAEVLRADPILSTLVPESMFFENMAEFLVERDFSAHVSSRELTFTQIQRQKVRLLLDVGKRPAPDYIVKHFPWVKYLDLELHEEKEWKDEPHPFVRHPDVAKAIGQFGFRKDIKKDVLSPFRLMGAIRAIDPFFPRHIDTDGLIRLISNPLIIDDAGALSNVLRAIGADPPRVPAIVASLQSMGSAIKMAATDIGVTWGDPVMNVFESSLLKEMKVSINDIRISHFISGLAYQYAVRRTISDRVPYNYSIKFKKDIDAFTFFHALGRYAYLLIANNLVKHYHIVEI
jgi:hypothetical protein